MPFQIEVDGLWIINIANECVQCKKGMDLRINEM